MPSLYSDLRGTGMFVSKLSLSSCVSVHKTLNLSELPGFHGDTVRFQVCFGIQDFSEVLF